MSQASKRPNRPAGDIGEYDADAVALSLLGQVETPALVCDERRIANLADHLARLAEEVGCKALFTLKPQTIADVMRLLAPKLHGFSASSLFEATLAREILGDGGVVHITTPGFRPDEIEALADLCDCIAFNSLSQWRRFGVAASRKALCGLRVNPQLPFVPDDRYNPCRRHSKLGVPMSRLQALLADDPGELAGLTGLHFHTHCDSRDFRPLMATVQHLDAHLSDLLETLQWVNVGGGYLYGKAEDLEPFRQAVSLLRGYDLEVFVEPGASLVRDGGYLVASVIDLFDSDGKAVAVLDTSVNHMPEVFEYQESPRVAGQSPDGPHRYLLAGCTCLAGDLFGEYAFPRPLEVGSQVVFLDMGAYTMVKWHWFNGVNIPAICARTESGEVVVKTRCAYENFSARCGGNAYVTA